MYRVHPIDFAPTKFNPGVGPRTRWGFFGTPPVPLLYVAATPAAAVAETILHDKPLRGAIVLPPEYRRRALSVVAPTRPLRLAMLHSAGLRRVGVHQTELTDTPAAGYPRTVPWAAAVHALGDLDGIVWMARQWNADRCVVLFGDRVTATELDAVVDDPDSRDFRLPADVEWLAALCLSVGVDLKPPS